MKKNILSVLTIMLILVSLVSCDMFNMGESGATKGLTSVTFTTGNATKALSVTTDAVDTLVNKYYWFYKAEKTDGGPSSGTKTEYVHVSNDKGLDTVLTGFSVGSWKFTLASNQSSGSQPQNPIDISCVLEAGKVNYITVDMGLDQSKGGKGTLVFKDITVPTTGGVWSYSLDGGANFEDFLVSTPTVETDEFYNGKINKSFTLPEGKEAGLDDDLRLVSGSYDVVIKGIYTGTGDNADKNTVRRGEITVQVYDNTTTTISGSIDDLTTAVEFVGTVYTLSYNSNLADDAASYTGTIPEAEKAGGNVVVKNGIEADGSLFLGWNTKADGSGDTYQPGDIILVKEDITLYAMWTYRVTYDSNGATAGIVPVDPIVYSGGAKATVLAKSDDLMLTSSDSRETWAFIGWTDNEEGTGTIYKAGDEVAFNANTTLYAKWDQVKGFSKTKDGSGRTGSTWTVLWYEDSDNDGQNDAPKFADFNVGATIDDYATVTERKYATAYVGGLYCWGGNNEWREGDKTQDPKSGSDMLTGNSDTATRLWGSNWKMPTKENYEAMVENCVSAYCDGKDSSDSGYSSTTSKQYIAGCKLPGVEIRGKEAYSDYSIFIPTAGYFYCYIISGEGMSVYLWTSTCNNIHGYYMYYHSYSSSLAVNSDSKTYFNSVRAILAE